MTFDVGWMENLFKLVAAFVSLITTIVTFGTAFLLHRASLTASPDTKAVEWKNSNAIKYIKYLLEPRVLVSVGSASMLVGVAIIFLWFWRPTSQGIFRWLQIHDASVFGKTDSGVFELARAFPSKSSLIANTNIADEWKVSMRSLDFMATSGTLLLHQATTIDALLQRGVDVRIIVVDTKSNEKTYDDVVDRINGGMIGGAVARQQTETTLADLRLLAKKCRDNRKKYLGVFMVRAIPAPLCYSSWIRDADLPSALGHIEVFFMNQAGHGPSIRVGADAKETLSAIKSDFDWAWDHSTAIANWP